MSEDSLKSLSHVGLRPGRYRSILQVTGLAYKYKQSIAFAVIWVTALTIPMLVDGIPISTIASDGIWLSRPWIILYMTYLVRNTMREFMRIFDLGEERRSDIDQGARNMFSSDNEYDQFRRKVYRITFSPMELVFGIIGFLGMTFGTYYLYAPNAKPPYYGFDVFGKYDNITMVSYWITVIGGGIFGFLVGASVWMVFGIIGSVIFMGRSGVVPEDIKKGKILRRKPITDKERLVHLNDTMKFFDFHRSVRKVGDFMYRFCLKIIIASLIWVLVLIYGDVVEMKLGQVGPGALIISVVMMLIVFAMFVTPQLAIHRMIVTFKEGVVLELDLAYEDVHEGFMRAMYDPDFSKSGQKWKDRGDVREDRAAIEGLLNHTKSLGSWSFSFPTALKLLAAATIPLLTAIIQAVAPILGGMAH